MLVEGTGKRNRSKPRSGRMKLIKVNSRWDNRHLIGCVTAIQLVLILNFVVRACDHEIGTIQNIFFGTYPLGHFITLLDFFDAQSEGEQPTNLVPT